MKWTTFDADKPDATVEAQIDSWISDILAKNAIPITNRDLIQTFAKLALKSYVPGTRCDLNTTLGIHCFKPHEFDSITSYDESLAVLINWLKSNNYDWRQGSKAVQIALNQFPKAGSKKFAGGRESVIVDNLVTISDMRVAVEIETSNNIDNGYFSLRQALQSGRVDYGVMIVPWTAEGQGRADEGKALGRLDREYEGGCNVTGGPIYRIAIIRQLDVYRKMIKRFSGG